MKLGLNPNEICIIKDLFVEIIGVLCSNLSTKPTMLKIRDYKTKCGFQF